MIPENVIIEDTKKIMLKIQVRSLCPSTTQSIHSTMAIFIPIYIINPLTSIEIRVIHQATNPLTESDGGQKINCDIRLAQQLYHLSNSAMIPTIKIKEFSRRQCVLKCCSDSIIFVAT